MNNPEGEMTHCTSGGQENEREREREREKKEATQISKKKRTNKIKITKKKSFEPRCCHPHRIECVDFVGDEGAGELKCW